MASKRKISFYVNLNENLVQIKTFNEITEKKLITHSVEFLHFILNSEFCDAFLLFRFYDAFKHLM